MTARRWLQHLDRLHSRARACFLHALFRVKLLRRRLTAPRRPSTAGPADGAGLTLSDSERELRLLCTEPVALTPPYREWIEPLTKLPAAATPAQVAEALEKLSGGRRVEDASALLFSWRDYAESLPANLKAAAEFVQFGHASRRPAMDWLAFICKVEAPQQTAVPRAVLALHSRSAHLNESNLSEKSAAQGRPDAESC